MEICAFFISFKDIAPKQKMVVVHDTATKIGLTEDGDVVDTVIVGQRLDKAVTQTGFTGSH